MALGVPDTGYYEAQKRQTIAERKATAGVGSGSSEGKES